MSLACIYRLRRTEPGFREEMDAAREAADARLRREEEARRLMDEAGVAGVREEGPSTAVPAVPLPCEGKGGLRDAPRARRRPMPLPDGGERGLVVRRGIGGRLRVMAASPRWWRGRDDGVFLAFLAATGNIAGSARAAGFAPKSAWNRRRRLPGFARAMEAALADAEIRLEYKLFAEALEGRDAMAPDPEAGQAAAAKPFDPELAMWLLDWRDRKRAGALRMGGRRRREADLGKAIAAVMRNIDAIERYEARYPQPGGERDRSCRAAGAVEAGEPLRRRPTSGVPEASVLG